jgi:hypothetical protein
MSGHCYRSMLVWSEVDGHAVVGCGRFGVGEPAEHVGGHVGEHDPVCADLPEVGRSV